MAPGATSSTAPTLAGDWSPPSVVMRNRYGCANGGSADISALSFAAGAGRSLAQRYERYERCERCEWEMWVHDGDVDYRLEPYGRRIC